MAIKPDDFKRHPVRPIAEIAKDLLQFPLERKAEQPFDSSQRVPDGQTLQETLPSMMKNMVRCCARLRTRNSLVEKKLGNSEEQCNQLLDAFSDMAKTNQFTDEQRQVVARFALPLLELLARNHEEMAVHGEREVESGEASEIDMKLNKLREARGLPPHDFGTQEQEASNRQYFYQVADNIRGPVRKLIEELGRAMKVDLESKVSLA